MITMSRSERFFTQSRHSAWMAATTFSASVCAGVWSVRAWLSSPAGGLVGFAIVLAGLITTCLLILEAVRCHRLAETELHWERRSAIRPRL